MVFPGCHVHEVFVVPSGFAVVGLVFFAEMASTGFFAFQSIGCQQFAKLKEVSNSTGLLQALVE
jgi:hypothetical protein